MSMLSGVHHVATITEDLGRPQTPGPRAIPNRTCQKSAAQGGLWCNVVPTNL